MEWRGLNFISSFYEPHSNTIQLQPVLSSHNMTTHAIGIFSLIPGSGILTLSNPQEEGQL